MTQASYLLLAIAIGFGSAVQTGLIGSLARSRGPAEAAWISLLATLCGLAVIFSVRAFAGNPVSLSAPLNSAIPFVAIALLGATAMVISMRGLGPHYAITGLFGFAYLVAAGFLAPRLGIALFASAVTAGTLIGSVGLDHVGAFGLDTQRVSVVKLMGLFALIAGVVLVRLGR